MYAALNANQIFIPPTCSHILANTHTHTQYTDEPLFEPVYVCVGKQNKNNCKFNFIIKCSCPQFCVFVYYLSAAK